MQNIFPSSRPLRAEFDRDAFRSNIEVVESLAPGSKVMVVVKANAYGHGLVEMAREAGDRDLAVAIPSEASVLVDAGITSRIWVLEGPFSQSCLSLSESAELVWVIHSEWQLELLEAYSLANDFSLTICLKIDTGMKRLGFDKAQLSDVKVQVESIKGLKLHAVMTHFADSDEPENEKVIHQIKLFDDAIQESGLNAVSRTLSNSGGVLFYPSSHADYVRPGIMLYGGMPSPSIVAGEFQLKPVMSLRSGVIALRDVAAGEAVGYGGYWRASRDSRVAVVAIGYGDGYPRHAERGTPVGLVDSEGVHHIVPLVGRVSMDMITIDVTDLGNVNIGNEVELWGANVSADQVAQSSGTISYELFCNISTRVPRVYK